jgi:hypothetical protein
VDICASIALTVRFEGERPLATQGNGDQKSVHARREATVMDICEADRSKPLEKNLDFIRRARDGGRIRPVCWRTV